jgi:outer membrane receptor protein involved in Fe transport
VAVKHHSPFTVAPTWVGTVLKELAPETIVDASISYQLTKNVGLRVQARNLTNERSRFSSDNNPQNLSNDGGYQVYGRSYLMDVSVKF